MVGQNVRIVPATIPVLSLAGVGTGRSNEIKGTEIIDNVIDVVPDGLDVIVIESILGETQFLSVSIKDVESYAPRSCSW